MTAIMGRTTYYDVEGLERWIDVLERAHYALWNGGERETANRDAIAAEVKDLKAGLRALKAAE